LQATILGLLAELTTLDNITAAVAAGQEKAAVFC
jgi:hypothetical protein